ncbi:hypothetical protein [Thermophilibacter immobilis]|jgi:hypothetical protein|uniref:Uncharacterized protein n=1 Tax=Thermophilibacter immobilis TaxID=2779519 RepID=A0A7S7M8V4_9ACTN|nr:hypothetical protein [Thermophilibacter immobilis]QOY60592.1 hypothetical protein INP52_09425 [Thermophilibacter immobilis]
MASARDARRRAYLDKAAAEVDELVARGVRMGGNAFSPILLAKGELTVKERDGAEPFSCADGAALKASLKALGYAPEEWETLLSVNVDGAPLGAALMREAVCTLDPATLVCCDEAAADAVREAFADDLASIETLEEAMLVPGAVAQVCGMRVLNLGGFAEALGDAHEKQVMWARLKRVPPLGEPF